MSGWERRPISWRCHNHPSPSQIPAPLMEGVLELAQGSADVSPSIREGDLWDAEMPRGTRCLLSARLFPVLHAREELGLQDVLWLLSLATVASEQLAHWRTAWRMSWQELLPCLDTEAELNARQALFFLQGQRKVRRVLLGRQDSSLLPLARSAVHEGYHEALLGTLDEGELDSGAASQLIRTVQCCSPPSVIPPLLRDAMGVYLQGIQQAWVGASHASPTPLWIVCGRSGLVGAQPAVLCSLLLFYFIF